MDTVPGYTKKSYAIAKRRWVFGRRRTVFNSFYVFIKGNSVSMLHSCELCWRDRVHNNLLASHNNWSTTECSRPTRRQTRIKQSVLYGEKHLNTCDSGICGCKEESHMGFREKRSRSRETWRTFCSPTNTTAPRHTPASDNLKSRTKSVHSWIRMWIPTMHNAGMFLTSLMKFQMFLF